MVRYTTLVKLYGKPVNSMTLSEMDYREACLRERVLTVFDSGYGMIGGHRVVDVSGRYVFLNRVEEKHVCVAVIGLSKMYD